MLALYALAHARHVILIHIAHLVNPATIYPMAAAQYFFN